MRVAVFSSRSYDERFLRLANERYRHELEFFETRLRPATVRLAEGADAVCAFVNDDLGTETLERLAAGGIGLIVLRSAGFNHVDLESAERLGLTVARVPRYSPHAVAEHCVGLILALNRNIHRAHNRVRDSNFSLEGLLGFEIHGRTVGIIGTGEIGACFAEIMAGFGTRILAADPYENPRVRSVGGTYVSIDDALRQSDIVSLHCPLTPDTFHLINAERLEHMKEGVMIINTSRGALVDADAAVEALKSGRIGHLGLDVYEEESDLFFEDLSNQVLQDDTFARLLSFPNVLITGHQAFFTETALTTIADVTLENVSTFQAGETLSTLVKPS
ncbi:MAG: 2-hydroxyacid dehydrogenase [Acidimicrobiia bacterium]|nr:2-hydroxyacid dehydrogenase [Acidimicrobiia bacterium]